MQFVVESDEALVNTIVTMDSLITLSISFNMLSIYYFIGNFIIIYEFLIKINIARTPSFVDYFFIIIPDTFFFLYSRVLSIFVGNFNNLE